MTEPNGTVELSEAVRSRRTVLAGGGMACLAMILAACGGETETPGGTTTGTTGAAPGTTGGEATPGETGTDAPGGDADVLAKVSEVPAGGGKVVGNVMLVKLAGGTIKAYDVRCTHQLTPVKTPVNGQMRCPNHQSLFKAEDGSVIEGPATVALRTVDVKVEGENVVRA